MDGLAAHAIIDELSSYAEVSPSMFLRQKREEGMERGAK